MTWIKTIPYDEATGNLKRIYEKVKGPNNNVDNILMAHSLRPNSLKGHMVLYKNVLHSNQNTIPKWFLETLGVYVSIINKCPYCVEHHFAGLVRLVANDERSATIRKVLESHQVDEHFEGKELALLLYAKILTVTPQLVTAAHIQQLRDAGLDDGEILEANQVISYFCYANRTVLGLGVNIEGDILGLSPNDNDDADNWQHS